MIELKVTRMLPSEEVAEFERMVTPQSVFEDIEELKEKVALLESYLDDSGWMDLPLADGIKKWSDVNTPQYRRIGKLVFIRGAVKGITERNIVLGTLPEGFRPSIAAPYPQHTSMRTGNFAMFSRLQVSVNGEVKLEAITDGAAYDPTKWFPIGTVFAID